MRKAGSRSWTRLATAGMLGLAGFAVYGGAAEPAADNARLPQITSVTHTPSEPHSDEPVRITANVRFRPSKVTLNYQLVDPGEYIDLKDAAFETNWIGMPMADRGWPFYSHVTCRIATAPAAGALSHLGGGFRRAHPPGAGRG